ncbi:MAG: glycosyltransferase [Clostridia bacterium]|nr:glycosyltransferase [Clostridia bacterium]
MFFSIILPIYNVEKYLEQCIESILCQSFDDYELILVDDGSKDKSPSICDRYAEKDARIKVIHKENGGLSDARNVGTKLAQGFYIIYIDSDDYVISTSFLNDIYEQIKKTESDLILYKFSKYYDDTKKLADCTFSFDFINTFTNSDELWYELVKRDAYYGMAWIKAFRRKIVEENRIQFEKGLLGEDMDWYFDLVLHSKTISAIDCSYIAYRQRSGSITTTIKLKNLTDFIYILEKWSAKIEQESLSAKKKQALMGALAKYYSNLLITYTRITDPSKKKFKNQIKRLSFLLDYGISARPIQIKKIYRILGFDGVIFLLKMYDRLK